MEYGEIIGSLAAALAALALLLVKLHGSTCKDLQKNYARKSEVAELADQVVSRTEFNGTIVSLRGEVGEQTKQLRAEIHEGYRHIELRIDNSTRAIYDRIETLSDRIK